MDLEELEGLIRDHGLEAHRDAIVATVRPAILLRLGEAGQGMAGESRIGGIPDLPDSLPWPTDPRLGRNLTFLLQIDLAALPAFPGNPLPAAGMLYLFADENEDDPQQLVLYTGSEPLRPRRPAPGAAFVTDWYDRLVPHRLLFDLVADVPRWATEDFYALLQSLDGAHDEEDGLGDLGHAVSAAAVGKLLGHASGIGHDPREDAYVVREENPAWLYDYQKRGTLDMSRAGRWHNLLEVDSTNEVNLMFGDAGYLQVLVHADDLHRQDFSRVYVNLQSS
ncbi:MAG TPA: YwqG family protein [Longimicrobium sp.]|nr:YwqG family protein [Longimicrobium sp.]